jgi:quercetin 2,3-dioxygenase
MNVNELPGQPALFAVRNGQGPRKLLGGMVASAYVTPRESRGAFALTMLSGSEGAGLPMLRHPDTLSSIFVLDGILELVLEDGRHRLSRGDSASLPPGTRYGLRMLRPRTVALWAQTGAAPGALVEALGTDYAGVIPPASDAGRLEDVIGAAPQEADTEILDDLPGDLPLRDLANDLPNGEEPFALAAGEGARILIADQLFTFAARNQQTAGRMLTLVSEGPAGDMIPPHKHLRHDEMFFCLDGLVRLRSSEAAIDLAPGDFLFVPRDTPHAYQFLHPYTRMLGWLYPGVFEEFFFTLGEFTPFKTYPQQPAPFRFDRVLARIGEFDIVPLGVPPASAPAESHHRQHQEQG